MAQNRNIVNSDKSQTSSILSGITTILHRSEPTSLDARIWMREMKILGLNIAKARLSYCLIDGSKAAPRLVSHSYEKFDPKRPIPEMANYFKQTFSEIITKTGPERIAYRMSLESKKDSIPYLLFSYGILNLIAHERGLDIKQTISQTFSAKALGLKGDKFTVCDTLLKTPSVGWDNNYRYAALSALVSFDA